MARPRRKSTRQARRVTHSTPSSHPEAAKLNPRSQTRTGRSGKVTGWQRLAPKNVWAWAISKTGRRVIGLSAASFFLILLLFFLWIAKDLPSPNKINSKISAQTTKLYDRTGQTVLIEIYGDKNRSVVQLDQIPKQCREATIALEDKNFYNQGAFSISGIGRAFSGILFRDPSKGGGSTITQQYVKNAFLTGERTPTRKAKELILAMQIELLYKKDDILQLYLNEIPYGSTAYGIQAGARTYFDKNVQELNLAECAALASLPQAPSYYNLHRDALAGRQETALNAMADQGYITKAEAEAAVKQDVVAGMRTRNYSANVTAPHFVQYVRGQLEEKYGEKTVDEGGLKVITTLDLSKQKIAEDAVKSNIDSVRKFGGSNAALVSEDVTTGEMLSMVGSYDYNDEAVGNFNVAAAERQPGSSFKPIVYATLFKGNWGAGSTMYDVTTDFGGGYKPQNYTKRTYGVQGIRTALASSLNIPAVKALYIAGIPETIQTANDLGITTIQKSDASRLGLSMALGAGEVKLTEMVNAFSAFPAGGQIRDQVTVLSVTDPSGKVLEKTTPDTNKAKQVIDPQIAYEIASIMSDNGARCALGVFTCNNPLTIKGKTVAAKTGTTEDYKDAWTMGYTTKTVTGVWAGNNDNKPMTQSASIVSAPIWNTYMTKVTAAEADTPFVRPAGIKEVEIDADTGKTPNEATKRRRKDIFAAWYKPDAAPASTAGKVNSLDNTLATQCTPPDALKDVSANSISAEIPSKDISYARWQPPVAALAQALGFTAGSSLPTTPDTMHNCSDTKPGVSISVTPSSGSTFNVTATVTSGTFPANKLVYLINDQEFTSQQVSGTGVYPLEIKPATEGPLKIQVKVLDTALYAGLSNAVNVTGTSGDADLGCSGTTCTVTGANIQSVALSITRNGGSTSTSTKSGPGPISFSGYASGRTASAVVTFTSGRVVTLAYP